MTKIYNIYKITNNIDDNICIGSTSQTLEKRLKEHLYVATRNNTNKLYIHMRYLGFEHFRIKLIRERFTSNPTFLEQCEINKYDDDILLNMLPVDASAKLFPYSKERRDTIKFLSKKLVIIIY